MCPSMAHPDSLELLAVLSFLALLKTVFSGEFCPSACSCFQSEGRPTADCHDQGLTEVPPDIPSHVMTLHLDGNNFGKIRRSKYFARRNLENLVSLSLKNCNITEIGTRTFSDLSIIEFIDLSVNFIEKLPKRAFSGLTRLKSVDLSHNLLFQIDGTAFSGAPLLRIVNLSYNRIKYILNDAFQGLIHLNRIYLQGNRLFQLEKTPFFRMNNLKLLRLEENRWKCDCYLRDFVDWQLEKYLSPPPECFAPEAYKGKKWDRMTLDEFACAPKFYGNRKDTKKVSKLGTSVTFSCPLKNADPPAIVTWKFRAANSSEERIISRQSNKYFLEKTMDSLKPNAWNYTLKIVSVSASEEGRYQCIGKNKAGYEHETFDLEILWSTASGSSIPSGASATPGSGERTSKDPSVGDLWLIIVVAGGILLIFIVLLVIAIYYRKSRGAQGTKNFKSVNGYGYQVIEGGFSPADKAPQHNHQYIEDCYLPHSGISYTLPPPHSDKQALTGPTEAQLPQDDSGYLEAPSDPPQHSPRRPHRRAHFPQQPMASGPFTEERSNPEDELINRQQQFLRNGKAPLAQQEKADNMKMPLRETAL